MALDSIRIFAGFFPAIGSTGKKEDSGSNPNCLISSEYERRTSSISLVEQFPSLIQTILGGGPNKKLLWLKSVSLETMVKPSRFAYSQTSISAADANPTSCTCTEPGNSSAKAWASL